MPIRWYISPYAGAGTALDPFHAAAWDYTDPALNQCFGTYNAYRQHFVVRVDAPQTTHDAIIAAGAGKPIGKLFTDNIQEDAEFDTPVTDDVSGLEADGINTAWKDINSTHRDVLRYALRTAHLAQMLRKNPAAQRLLSLGLNSTASDLTAQQRTTIRTWMTSKGMAIGWITNATTVRQLIHHIVTNLRFGKISVMGKDF